MKVLKLYGITDETNYVRVDRQSRWGNPFVMGADGDRDTVCDLFEQYAEWRLTVQPDWLDDLKDKDLACHCAPKRCHAETLIRLANR
jgi:hypothetical protein